MRKRVRFWMQPTPSFPDGAPQRENYRDDKSFLFAVAHYDKEWLEEFKCLGCAEEPGRHRMSCPEPLR